MGRLCLFLFLYVGKRRLLPINSALRGGSGGTGEGGGCGCWRVDIKCSMFTFPVRWWVFRTFNVEPFFVVERKRWLLEEARGRGGMLRLFDPITIALKASETA